MTGGNDYFQDPPTTDQTKHDEPTTDQTKHDEPTTDQTKHDEPTTDQIKHDEPTTRTTVRKERIDKIKRMAIGTAKDLLLAFVVVLLVMGLLLAYCGVWPPMVVVESGSMMHDDDSHVGVIDTGDMVLVKNVAQRSDIVTYIEGEGVDYRTYGEFGDVVIYRPNGDKNQTPIIHRAVIWLEVNNSGSSPLPGESINYANYSYDIPSLGLYGIVDDIKIDQYGYASKDVYINLSYFLNTSEQRGLEPHSGFISMGDHNMVHDQRYGGYLPIKVEWILGKAVGELPWFGLIKLTFTSTQSWTAPPSSVLYLWVSIAVLVGVPLFLDLGWPRLKKKIWKGGTDEKEDTVDERPPTDKSGAGVESVIEPVPIGGAEEEPIRPETTDADAGGEGVVAENEPVAPMMVGGMEEGEIGPDDPPENAHVDVMLGPDGEGTHPEADTGIVTEPDEGAVSPMDVSPRVLVTEPDEEAPSVDKSVVESEVKPDDDPTRSKTDITEEDPDS